MVIKKDIFEGLCKEEFFINKLFDLKIYEALGVDTTLALELLISKKYEAFAIEDFRIFNLINLKKYNILVEKQNRPPLNVIRNMRMYNFEQMLENPQPPKNENKLKKYIYKLIEIILLIVNCYFLFTNTKFQIISLVAVVCLTMSLVFFQNPPKKESF